MTIHAYSAAAFPKTSLHQSNSRQQHNTLRVCPAVSFQSKTTPKKVAILTTNVGGSYAPGFRSFLEQLEASGEEIEIIHPQEITIQTDTTGLSVWIKDQHYTRPPFDIIMPMIGARYVTEGMLLALEALESMGVDIINSPQGIRRGENKMNTHLTAASFGLAQPLTQYRPGSVHGTPTQLKHVQALGIAPKQKQNAYTSGAKSINTLNNDPKLIASLQKPDVIMQENIKRETFLPPRLSFLHPWNFRYMVFDGKVIRGTQKDDGHFIVPMVRNGPKRTKLALDAMKAAGLRYGTVDMVQTGDGLKLLEVNPCPRTFSVENALVLSSLLKYRDQNSSQFSTFG